MNNSNLFRPSKVWKKHSEEMFSDTINIDLTDFRQPGKLNKFLASWDPYEEQNYRYYKNILFNLALSMPEKFFFMYKQLGKTDLGNPVFVIVKDNKINLDYLFSIQEILFCEEILLKVKSVTEIGAGFGRTCHSIINNFQNINEYTIIDLPDCLNLSMKYLKAVLSTDSFKKVKFVSYEHISDDMNSHLVINIDSFQEMETDVINNYLSWIREKSQYFYSKNAICKYDPQSIGIKKGFLSKKIIPLSLGLCKDIVDIFNDEELSKARKKYIKSYNPGINWHAIKDDISEPWKYYHQVLYKKQ